MIVEDELDLDGIASMNPRLAVRELIKVKGVGPWIARLSYMSFTGYMGLELFEDISLEGYKCAKYRC